MGVKQTDSWFTLFVVLRRLIVAMNVTERREGGTEHHFNREKDDTNECLNTSKQCNNLRLVWQREEGREGGADTLDWFNEIVQQS